MVVAILVVTGPDSCRV